MAIIPRLSPNSERIASATRQAFPQQLASIGQSPDTAEPDLNDPILDALRGSNDAKRSVGIIDDYLDQSSPDQLLKRYENLAGSNISDIDSYLKKTYGVSTAKDKAYYSAYKSAQDLLGRPLTSNEFAQLAPSFYNPADFSSGITTGRAALAQLAERDKQNPENLKTKAPQYTDQVNGLFQDLLKRGASQDEIQHFGTLLASGSVDPYELRTFIQATPEFQTQEDTKFRGSLANELQGYDQDFFSKAKNDVLSQFSNQGITPGTSSSLDFALTDLMGKIATQRGQYLAGLSSSQYQGNKDAARNDYLSGMNNYLGQRNYTQQKSDQNLADFQTRGFNAMDYNTQRNDYLNFLNSQGGRGRSGLGGAIGPVLGAGIGAIGAGMVSGGMGAPQGAALGAKLGGAGGGAYDYLSY